MRQAVFCISEIYWNRWFERREVWKFIKSPVRIDKMRRNFYFIRSFGNIQKLFKSASSASNDAMKNNVRASHWSSGDEKYSDIFERATFLSWNVSSECLKSISRSFYRLEILSALPWYGWWLWVFYAKI